MPLTPQLSLEVADLLAIVAKLPRAENQTVFQLLVRLGESLHVSLKTILDTVALMQQSEASLQQQEECIHAIRHSSNQMLKSISDVVIVAQTALGKQQEALAELQQIEFKQHLEDLMGVTVLVVGEDEEQCNKILQQLKENGLQGKIAAYDTALQVLYEAEKKQRPLQIVIVIAKNYDPHTAYLGRTIRANTLLGNAMMGLALPNELLIFEKDQIHFDGFTCILNLTQPNSLITNLANSWRGWAAKMHFAHADIHSSKIHILLVEDDLIAQKAVQLQLTALGFSADIATDGLTALTLLEQKTYDLIFMDIGLPDISGLEVTAEIRKQECDCHTPIIGLTTYKTAHIETSGLEAGLDEFLVKPLLPEQLQDVLQRWVKKPALRERDH